MKQLKSAKASLEHLVFYPETTASRHSTIVALHGRGTDEYDLLPLVEALGLSDLLVIAARAPFPFHPGGLMAGYAWYEPSQEGTPHPQTFQTSLNALRNFLGEIKVAYPVNPERLVLLGFSQGTVMAYAVGLLDPESVRGIAALSGYVPRESGLPFKIQQLNRLPIFISHGTLDIVIPVKFGRESAEFLKTAGADVTYLEYPMGHEVREETLRDLNDWMRKLLAEKQF
jgi:phospholipase/carboxylesterase